MPKPKGEGLARRRQPSPRAARVPRAQARRAAPTTHEGALESQTATCPRNRGNFNKRRRSSARGAITVALGRIGPAASDAVPVLESWRENGDEAIRVLAARALRRIRSGD
jgi:hypothetical protein